MNYRQDAYFSTLLIKRQHFWLENLYKDGFCCLFLCADCFFFKAARIKNFYNGDKV